ncbi:glutathione S-transferase [Endozoicomonas sp. G2_1]|uniref:glutathione S-transferase family protein n=1 Tax=Endozoicomonas sp. G2_1 TaxID=2821091 RepID=UPI001ADC21D6|nr:glutathione S-transferase family protein [Endozoicomonas sp. G2_1]MBO9491085.1 glutathione S-transferase [Endozoicomonas sp. G2_1]
MKLFGSTTSPYVRRLRILLRDHDYEFVNLDIFADDDRKTLLANNPTMRVPALQDGEQSVYDSRIIYRYLSEKLNLSQISWQQENLFTLIDAANDSLVSILLSKRSGLPVEQDILFFNLQRQRVDSVLTTLNDEVAHSQFNQWDYLAICLFCLLDWVEFRELADWRQHPHLVEFYQWAQQQAGVVETDPR